MKQELNTILAALRFYQQNLQNYGAHTAPMTIAEIDKLCERLNCGVSLFCYVASYPDHDFDHTFVQAENAEAAWRLGQAEFPGIMGYVAPCGPLLQPAHCDSAALIVVRGGIAEIADGSTGNIRIIDLDNIDDGGDGPEVFARGEGWEEIFAGCDALEDGTHYAWADDAPVGLDARGKALHHIMKLAESQYDDDAPAGSELLAEIAAYSQDALDGAE